MSSELTTNKFVTAKTVHEVFGSGLVGDSRMIYPRLDEDFEFLGERISDLKGRGDLATLVLVDGAMDVPQPSHEWYLRHVRTLGAAVMLEKAEMPVSTETLREAVMSDLLSVVVTVDADHKIASKKGGLAEKGGSVRPIYPWQSRAERVAGYSFALNGTVKHVVDVVTVEGDPEHRGTILEDSLRFATHLQNMNLLDALVVYGEHSRTVVDALRRGINTLVIPEHPGYPKHPVTGEEWSSSGIIERARGTAPAWPTDS